MAKFHFAALTVVDPDRYGFGMARGAVPDFFARDFKADPYPTYQAMRDDAPVRAVDVPAGRLWLVTRYAEARQALNDPRLVKDPVAAGLAPPYKLPEQGRIDEHMLNADPPVHTRLRRLVSTVFTAGRIEALRPRVRQIAEELVVPLAMREGADLLTEFAIPMPIIVICELLGVPMRDRDAFRSWSNAILAAVATGERPDANVAAMAGYVHELVAAKRHALGDDLLSELIAVREDGDRLSEAELVSMVFLLLIAGHETTVNLIGNGMYLLLTHPDQYRRLRADHGLIPAAVEEFLRYESPVESASPRWTAEPVEIGGVPIPTGELVLVSLSSANRDEGRFTTPERFDIDRGESTHLAFGHGIHFCLGAPLARLEGQVAFETLLSRLPELTLAVPAEQLFWRPGILIRGLVDLPVRW